MIHKLAVTWNGLLPSFVDLVAGWTPPPLKNELAYRDHLLAVIRQSVPADTTVEREYRHRGTTIDIWLRWSGLFVQDEIAFELKLNLTKKAELDRLVGQVESLDPSNNKVLLVLIGKTEASLLGRLREKYAAQTVPRALDMGGTATFAIVEVPIVGGATSVASP